MLAALKIMFNSFYQHSLKECGLSLPLWTHPTSPRMPISLGFWLIDLEWGSSSWQKDRLCFCLIGSSTMFPLLTSQTTQRKLQRPIGITTSALVAFLLESSCHRKLKPVKQRQSHVESGFLPLHHASQGGRNSSSHFRHSCSSCCLNATISAVVTKSNPAEPCLTSCVTELLWL